MAAALPLVQETVENYNYKGLEDASGGQVPTDQIREETNLPSGSSIFAEITSSGITPAATTTQAPSVTGIARPIGLGIDSNIKAKIFANEYIKLASLLKPTLSEEPKFKSVEQNGQLMFIKTNNTLVIKTISQWMEAFLVFVGIYCQKYPEEVGHLMTYAQIVQGISKYCGDEAALDYNVKFRQWRQVEPHACPWNQKNGELFQEAILAVMD